MGGAGEHLLPFPQPRRNHHIHQTGLVFHSEECQSRGGAGALAVGDHAGDAHARAVGNVAELGGGEDAGIGKQVPDCLHRLLVVGDPGGGHVGGQKLKRAHPGKRGGLDGGQARQHAVAFGGGDSRLPQRLAAGKPKAVQRAGGGKCLHLGDGEIRPARQVRHVAKGSFGGCCRFDALGGLIAQPLDEVQAQPDLRRGIFPAHDAGLGPGIVNGSRQYLNPVAARVLDERLRRVKAHRLRAE